MNALIGIVIFLLGLIFSGLLYMFGLIQLTPVPYNIWLITSIALFFCAYKIKFKNKKVLRFFLLRKWIEFNGWFHTIDKKMTVGHHKLNPMQERAVKLWKLSLKDKDCVLRCSISTKERHVESGKILMTLTPSATDHYRMSIYDSSDNDNCNFYDVIIPQPHLELTCDQFDTEMNKRMFDKESSRKEIIEDTMETMLRKHEEMVRQKRQYA